MKKIVKITIGICTVALIAINADVLNAQVSEPSRPTSDDVSGYILDNVYCTPGGKLVKRCRTMNGACSVSAQDLC
ncbi:MAG: hypothetical protein AB7S48_06705 [Bacteroidales bacterium]